MLASFFLSFGFQAFTSSFYLYVVRRFDFGPKEYGQLLSCLGVTWTTTQAFIIPALRKSGQPEPTVLLCGACLLTAGRLTLAFAYTVPMLLFGELLVVSGAATTFTISSSLLSQSVPPDQVSDPHLTLIILTSSSSPNPQLILSGRGDDGHVGRSGVHVWDHCTASGRLAHNSGRRGRLRGRADRGSAICLSFSSHSLFSFSFSLFFSVFSGYKRDGLRAIVLPAGKWRPHDQCAGGGGEGEDKMSPKKRVVICNGSANGGFCASVRCRALHSGA